jgi:cation diffusion facilitator CzcD-associated flavoprotein CzcO
VAAKNLLHNSPVAEEFNVTLFDTRADIGGLWPLSKDDNGRQVHPLMLTNQSKHTVQFSDLAWNEDTPPFPQAWQVGQYLRRYYERYLKGNSRFEIKFGSTVSRTEKCGEEPDAQWDVLVNSAGSETSRKFDYLLVSTGFFGEPIVPDALKKTSSVPVIHSSQYRDLKGLLGSGRSGGGKILVVGGQMSGVEISGTIASHLSSAVHSPDDSGIVDVDNITIHHVLQRPVWVFPLFTTPEVSPPNPPICDY